MVCGRLRSSNADGRFANRPYQIIVVPCAAVNLHLDRPSKGTMLASLVLLLICMLLIWSRPSKGTMLRLSVRPPSRGAFWCVADCVHPTPAGGSRTAPTRLLASLVLLLICIRSRPSKGTMLRLSVRPPSRGAFWCVADCVHPTPMGGSRTAPTRLLASLAPLLTGNLDFLYPLSTPSGC